MSELPPVYLCKINIPGCLPQADEPDWSDSARGAWGWLLGEREAAEDHAADDGTGEYSDTVLTLRYLASEDHIPGSPHEDWPTDADGCGVVYGPTPGYDGEHDLGLAYSVTRIDHSDYPHPAGYLIDCRACEARCHCDGQSAPCVYQGEHS